MASKKKTKQFSQPKFFTSPIAVDGKNVHITFPKGILSKLKIKDIAHWTLTGEVIQISGKEPQVVIPLLASMEEFQAQK
jgi:hypothetical protein